MSIKSLAAKAAAVQDSEPHIPEEMGAGSVDTAAEVPAATSPANDAEGGAPKARATSSLRRGPIAAPSSPKADIMDETVDSSFAGAVAADSIERGIADAVDSNRPSLDEDEQQPGDAPAADTAAEPVSADMKVEDEDDDLAKIQAGPGPFLDLSALAGLGKGHEVLVELLSSAMNREDAVKTALEYNTYLQTEVLPAIENLKNLSEHDKEELRKRAEAEAARRTTGGGGAFSSLFSALGRPFKGGDDKYGRERRDLLAKASGHAETLAMRMSAKIKSNYVLNCKEAANANDALTRAVNSYNAAVFDAPECADIKQAFIDRAAQLDTTPDEILRAVTSGADHADLAAMVEKLPEGVSQRPDVFLAAEAMEAAREEMHDAFIKATRQAETLQKNIFDADIDIEMMRNQLVRAQEIAESELPRPVDKEKADELKKRMQEMREAIEAGFRNIIERLAQALGANKPK